MDRSFKKYWLTAFISGVLISFPFLLNLMFLYQARELTSLQDVVLLQQRKQALYGPAFLESTWTYKLALASVLKPEILVLGSSRANWLRGDVFTATFLNAGTAVHSLIEVRLFLESLFKIHRPRIVIFALDDYWFNPGYQHPQNGPGHPYDASTVTRYKLLSPFLWLVQRKISLPEYFRIMLGRGERNNLAGYDDMGVIAMVKSCGYRPDGSFAQCGLVEGKMADVADTHFQITKKQFVNENGDFVGAHIDIGRFRYFIDTLDWCLKRGVHCVVFLTPMSPALNDIMRANPANYQYSNELNDKLRSYAELNRIEYYDFRDARSIGSNDCEYADGFHVGEVGYYRLIRQLLKINPNSVLIPFIDIAKLDGIVEHFSGHVMFIGNDQEQRVHEEDFLDSGCSKN
jgi:hypothetical protein